MPRFKYTESFFRGRTGPALDPAMPLEAFSLAPKPPRSRLKRIRLALSAKAARFAFSTILPLFLGLCRRFWPNPRFGNLVIVTRAADVAEVLNNKAFTVPFGPEMRDLAGADSILGVEDTPHDRFKDNIKDALRTGECASPLCKQQLEQDLRRISEWSAGFAENLLDSSAGRIDVMTDLITRTATETCCRYFGFAVSDANEFAHWTMAVSSLLFADPFGDERTRLQALNAAARIKAVLDDAIERSHKNRNRLNETLIDRFVTAQVQGKPGSLSDAEIRSTLMGLATGFIPTNTLAAGNMLEQLLRCPAALVEASKHARQGRRDELRAFLLEAMRLNPPLAPGQWRYAADGGTIAEGTRRMREVPEGGVVLVATMTALRDPEAFSRPDHFNPERRQEPQLMFGGGPHECLGARIAMEQITEVFMALLKRRNLRVARGRHGKIERVGAFPVWLDMEFDAVEAPQSMITISAPVLDGTPIPTIEREIDKLENPAKDDIADTLTKTDLVHFASLSVIESGQPDKPPIIIFEVNADGARKEALESIARHCFEWLAPIFAHTDPLGRHAENSGELAALLGRHALDLKCRPWGATGLDFNGTNEFSVRDIERQERLAQFARKALDRHWRYWLGRNGRPIEALRRVRRFIKQDPYYGIASRLHRLLKEAEEFQFDIVRPSRTRPAITTWTSAPGWIESIWKAISSRDARPFVELFLLVWLIFGLSLWTVFGTPPLIGVGWKDSASNIPVVLWAAFGSAIASFIVTCLAVGAMLAAAAFLYDRNERADEPDNQPPRLVDLAPIVEKEDQPYFEQNHIIAVVRLKPGLFRRLVFAAALWGIRLSIKLWFRPGFVVTMGTIHYAKWFLVPGTNQFLFLGNYDGSWDSYLEDFVTRAHTGQTAAWSNGVGFPRTRWLVLDGARDGDRFKRWVRRQQRVTRFWYSRYPHLTTRQIRGNAMIEDGLARATNDTDARAWLSHFGSAQREEHELELDEIQSVVFNGFPSMPYASCLVIRLPEHKNKQARWLSGIVGDSLSNRAAILGDKWSESARDGKRKPLARALQVAFGDRPAVDGAAYIAFSALGLKHLGLPGSEAPDGLGSFPAAYNLGMSRRARILGDGGETAPENWKWTDADAAENVEPAHAVLFVYGQPEPDDRKARPTQKIEATHAAHRALVDRHLKFLEECGGKVLHIVPTGPIASNGKDRLDVEHFGFRDGISQPVIRGTQRASRRPPDRDLIEPGEFLLGYRNNQGFFPPTAFVRAELDLRDALPVAQAGSPERFPRFGDQAAALEGHDFGRNGTFVVIRELRQHVDEFRKFTEDQADRINELYPRLSTVIGRDVDKEWIAAKMVGRWQDGSPLVGNPCTPAGGSDPPENDFAYGIDDPRGLQCPLGAHIRRTNPRDSLEPANEDEQRITNRHRLLRRGRSFDYGLQDRNVDEKGLLFACFCVDLERQFEFVQHTWATAPSFHGLTGEPDPLLGGQGQRPANRKRKSAASPQSPDKDYAYTIPTAGGAVTLEGMQRFVQMRGGGYFFVPSRSALRFLIDQAERGSYGEEKAIQRIEDVDQRQGEEFVPGE